MNTYVDTNLVVNGTSYTAKLGSVVDKYLSDALDSIVLNVKCKATDDFVRMTLVTVDNVYWYIGGVTPITKVYNIDGSPRIVNYEMSLYSPTYILTKKMTSAFQISQPVDDTLDRKILSAEINKLQYKVDGKPFNFLMTANMYLKTNVVAKEMNLTKATLQGALNALLSQVNCVVVGKIIDGDFYIDAKELAPLENSEITNLTSKNFDAPGNTYMTALNATITKGLSSSTTKSQGNLTLRSSTDFALNDSNAELVLMNDIYSITSLGLFINKIILKIQYTNTETSAGGLFETTLTNYNLDISTDHLLEKKAYEAKEPISSEWNFGDSISSDNQNFYIYYEMGKKLIQGFGKTWNNVLDFDQAVFSAIINYELYALVKTYKTDIMGDPVYSFEIYNEADVQETDFETDYTLWKFNVVYRAMEKYKLQIGKTLQDAYEEEIVTPDKQEESFVNVNTWGDNEQRKVDRSGNKIMNMTAKFASADDIPELGSTIGTYVLIHEQYIKYPSYVQFIGQLYDKYTANNMWNGIAQQKRIYQISTDYFDREILFKYKIRFTTQVEDTEDFTTDNTIVNKLIYSIYGGLLNSNSNSYALTDFFLFAKDSNNLDSIYYVRRGGKSRGVAWMQATNSVTGNSISVHMGCLNNSYIGNARDFEATASYGGYAQQKIRYTDDNGELERVSFGAYTQSEYENYLNYATDLNTRRLPYVGSSTVDIFIPYNYIYKSQNEKLGFTLQFECTASKDMDYTDLPYIAKNIILQAEDTSNATTGLIVTNQFASLDEEPYLTVISKTEIELTSTLETPVHILYLNGTKVLQWGSEQKLHIYIQR